MSTAYISEFADVLHVGGPVHFAYHPEIVTQTMTVSGTSAQTAALNPSTKLVRIHCDGISSFLVGTNPTALTTSPRLAASTDYWLAVPGGQTWKIAMITNT